MFSRLSRAAPQLSSTAIRAWKPTTTNKTVMPRIVKGLVGGAAVVTFMTATEAQCAEMDTKMLVGGAIGLVVVGGGLFMYFKSDDPKKNTAFVFVKPHACTDAAVSLVKDELIAKGIAVREEGEILGSVIDDKGYIDQHYYSIAAKAVLKDPSELNVPADKFQAQFGLGWKDALAHGLCYNAKQACSKLNMSSDELDKKWGQAKKAGNLIKFGGGFYCAFIDGIYIFNGFFMSMRSKFTGDAKIHYYVVEWDAGALKWEDFRGKVLGPTDPADGPRDSIRAKVAASWQSLGLKGPCNVGDNGVHASASPFEALAECTNWLEAPVTSESFGRQLLAKGITEDKIKEWSVDPQVPFAKDGKAGKFSLFDLVEDTDSEVCLASLVEIAAYKA